jgi:hypothetical protein
MSRTMRLDEHTTFHMIEVHNERPIGHFRLERATGSLAYAPAMFVVENGGAGRVWPLAAVTCLYANDADDAAPRVAGAAGAARSSQVGT